MKTYYVVCSKFYDDGHVESNIIDTFEADRSPKNIADSTPSYDWYLDYYDNYQRAMDAVESARMG